MQNLIENAPIKDCRGLRTSLGTGIIYSISLRKGGNYIEYSKDNYYSSGCLESIKYNTQKNCSFVFLFESENNQEDCSNYNLYCIERKNFVKLDHKLKKSSFKLSPSKDKAYHYSVFDFETKKFLSPSGQAEELFFEPNCQISTIISNFQYPMMQQTLSQISEKNKSEFFTQYTNEGNSTIHINLPITIENKLLFSWFYHKSPETEFLANKQTIIKTIFFPFNTKENQEITFYSQNVLNDSPIQYFIENDKECPIITRFVIPPREKISCNLVWNYIDIIFIFEAIVKFEVKADRIKKNGDALEVFNDKIDNKTAILLLESQVPSVFLNEKDEIAMLIKGDLHIKGNLSAKQTITETSKEKKKE